MMKRLHNILTILHFACTAIKFVCIEPKIEVTWSREGKQVQLAIAFTNHLFDSEQEVSRQ